MVATTGTGTAPRLRSRYELWQDTINAAVGDERWHEYDCDIQQIVTQFNRHLAGTGGYTPLDWRMVKAMVWTESGGPTNRAWRNNPIQIGNPGDPGLRALLSPDEGGALVIPPDLAGKLTVASAGASPQMNIRAGVAYLLMRHARFRFATVLDERDAGFYEVLVKPGDSLDKIARANGTTPDILRKYNGGGCVLRPGQKLKYRKAAVRKIIASWNLVTKESIATRYNVGDPEYSRKLGYCLEVMRKSAGREKACAT
ncbi:LysM peptidoglycan-binding domain-containing protein [Massilia cavernae]|uniref:LysM domain-containing protein n=1 Tax=Massilia cavernae TaxID=2320864 RepID=A0A418XGE5_9BURK|nr:LysM domain-containing protein [Massilia cavernae]RJG11538.1 LysM domain-containing protein [Massilia cavernae]